MFEATIEWNCQVVFQIKGCSNFKMLHTAVTAKFKAAPPLRIDNNNNNNNSKITITFNYRKTFYCNKLEEELLMSRLLCKIWLGQSILIRQFLCKNKLISIM